MVEASEGSASVSQWLFWEGSEITFSASSGEEEEQDDEDEVFARLAGGSVAC